MRGKMIAKRFVSSLLMLLMIASLFACNSDADDNPQATTTTAPKEINRVAVITHKLTENDEAAIKGLKFCAESNSYVEGDNFETLRYDTDSKDTLNEAVDNVVKEDVDVIFAIGEKAAQAAKKATESIPIVFLNVDDPIGANLLESCEVPEGNVTGVCDYLPVFAQINLIAECCPEAKRIGCIYNGSDEESIFTANLASGEAQTAGVKFTMYPALTKKNFLSELDKALNKCDVLYLPDDALVNSCLSTILKKAEKKNIPVFAETKELVEKGCVATVTTDYESLGYSAGELGIILLRQLKEISNIPVEYCDEGSVVVNSKKAEKLKLEVNEEVYSDVEYIK